MIQRKQWKEREKRRLTGAATRAITAVGFGQIADSMACYSKRPEVDCLSGDSVWHLQCSVGTDPYLKQVTTTHDYTRSSTIGADMDLVECIDL